MTHNYLFWLIAIIAAAFVGFGKGGVPMIGMLSVPMMSQIMPPLMATGLLLPIYILSDMFGLYVYRAHFSKKLLVILMPGGLAGVLLAWLGAHLVSDRLINGLIGAMGTFYALSLMWPRTSPPAPKPVAIGPGLFWGMVSGFTSFISHAGAPPYQIYTLPLNLPKQIYAGTTTIFFAWINLIKLPAYWSLGQIDGTNLRLTLWLMIPAACAVFIGARLVEMLPQRLFSALIRWALLLLSLQLLINALR